jgi:hypothetical protein
MWLRLYPLDWFEEPQLLEKLKQFIKEFSEVEEKKMNLNPVCAKALMLLDSLVQKLEFDAKHSHMNPKKKFEILPPKENENLGISFLFSLSLLISKYFSFCGCKVCSFVDFYLTLGTSGHFTDYSPTELAKQMVLFDAGLFSSIKPWEFFFLPQPTEEKAPNLLRMYYCYCKVCISSSMFCLYLCLIF